MAQDLAAENECRTLWMGAVQPHWDETFLSQLFSQVGPVTNVKVMRNSHSGLPTGYAFVDFPTHDIAEHVLSFYNGQGVPGTNVVFRLNWGSGGIRKVTGREYSLFVGDLSPQVTDPMLLQCFAAHFASTTSAKVITDAATGQSKGYGFVRFSDAFECDDALARMDGAIVGNRAIRVSPATAKKPNDDNWGGGGGGRQNRGQRTWATPADEVSPDQDGEEERESAAAAGVNNPEMGSLLYQTGNAGSITDNQAEGGGWEGNEQQHMAAAGGGGGLGVNINQQGQSQAGVGPPFHGTRNTTVFVGNLDASVAETDLQDHFQSFGGISSVKIPEGKGCGFVKYFHHVSARNAIMNLQGSMLGGSPLRLDWGKNHNRHHGQHHGHHLQSLQSGRQHQHGMSPMSPTGTLTSAADMADMNAMMEMNAMQQYGGGGYVDANSMNMSNIQTGHHHNPQQHQGMSYDTSGLTNGSGVSPHGQNTGGGAGIGSMAGMSPQGMIHPQMYQYAYVPWQGGGYYSQYSGQHSAAMYQQQHQQQQQQQQQSMSPNTMGGMMMSSPGGMMGERAQDQSGALGYAAQQQQHHQLHQQYMQQQQQQQQHQQLQQQQQQPPQLENNQVEGYQPAEVVPETSEATPNQLLEQMSNLTVNTATATSTPTAERPRTASSQVTMPAASTQDRRMLQKRKGLQQQRTSTAPSASSKSTDQVHPTASLSDKENVGGVKTMAASVEVEEEVHESKEGVVTTDAKVSPEDGKGGENTGSTSAEQNGTRAQQQQQQNQPKSFLMATMGGGPYVNRK